MSLLCPFAQIFEVTTDTLLGYDAVQAAADIDRRLADYEHLRRHGDFSTATAMIVEARRDYPQDWRIMVTYMKDIALSGEEARIACRDEISTLCDSLLDGCRQDNLRAEAIELKARLLHATGDTDGALSLLSGLPTWQAPIAKETLFLRNSEEYRFWNRRNAYGLLQVAVMKLARTVRYDPALSVTEKATRLEAMARSFAGLSDTAGEIAARIGESAIYACIPGLFTPTCADMATVIHVRQAQLEALRHLAELASADTALADCLHAVYGNRNPAAYEADRLLHSPHEGTAAWRYSADYVTMLEEYASTVC